MPVTAATPEPASAPAQARVALLGNPNTGKTTLFNALTGDDAVASNAHDVGGMADSATVARDPNAPSTIAARSRAWSRAVRTAGSRSSGWDGRRLRITVVSVVPGLTLHADGDAVIVVWDGHGVANDGRPYDNSYAWVMKMRDGKVIDGTAFYDSISFNDLWSRVEPAE